MGVDKCFAFLLKMLGHSPASNPHPLEEQAKRSTIIDQTCSGRWGSSPRPTRRHWE